MTTNSVQRPLWVVVLLTLVVLAVVLLLASAVGASPSAASSADPGSDTVTYTVVAGDTLWDIASTHIDPGDDVRRLIFDIKAANQLSDSIIHPGQELRIPTG